MSSLEKFDAKKEIIKKLRIIDKKISDTGGKYDDKDEAEIDHLKRKSFYHLIRSDSIIKAAKKRMANADASNGFLSSSFQAVG